MLKMIFNKSQHNKFLKTVKDHDQDHIEVEIGDTKQNGEFFPQHKIMRWDNEVNLSMRLIHNEENPTVSHDSDTDTVHWIGEKMEAHFYNLGVSEEHPEDAQELEVVLKEKPDTNLIQFTLKDKGIIYEPQYPDLIVKRQPEDGADPIVPENVLGSYAIYTKEHKQNFTGGKLYKAGKVGHIYRPKIIDAKGTWVWGKLNISEGILTVEIPQDFLDNAVYPVRHASGTTVGYTTIGGTQGQISSGIDMASIVQNYTANSGDTVTGFYSYEADVGSGSYTVMFAPYTYPSSVVTDRVGASGNFEFTVTSTDTTAKWWNGTGSVALTAGTTYVFVIGYTNSGIYKYGYRDVVSPPGRLNANGSQLATPFSVNGTDSGSHYSLYMVVTAGGITNKGFFMN